MTLLPRKVLRIWRDTNGSSLIEAAFIIPVLCLLAFGATDIALGFAQKLRVQQAADRAVQFALNVGLTKATQAKIQSEAATSSGLDPAKVAVNLWLECNKQVQPDFNGSCVNSAPARYLSVTVSDSYAPTFYRNFSDRTIQLRGFAEGRLQ